VSSVDHSDEFDDRGSPTSGADFDDGLSRAEALLRDVDRGQFEARMLQLVATGGILGVAFAVALAIAATSLSVIAATAVAAVGAGTAVLGLWFLGAGVMRPLARRVARDERAMIEIIGVLRELMGVVAEEEKWSASRQQLAKTRIARFPIGPRGLR